ncbi:hypothetical protein ES708_33452 [subsurface metagenome]
MITGFKREFRYRAALLYLPVVFISLPRGSRGVAHVGDLCHLGEWGEITSTSNCTDYQARRLSIRFKEQGKTAFVHMLNGTAIANSRTLIALLENFQRADGSVAIPEKLQEYTGFSEICLKK